MDYIIYRNCCGIAPGPKHIMACLVLDSQKVVRRFEATAQGLSDLAGWLEQEGCQIAALEDTAPYCKTLCKLLKASGIQVKVACLVPEKVSFYRKAGTSDAGLLAGLLQHGLL